MAKGKTLGSRRHAGKYRESPIGKDRTVQLMESPEYARQMGFVTACDLFLGNVDRVEAGNLGNWLTDEAGAVSLIDNFSSGAWQGLTRDAQQQWESSLAPDLAPSRYLAKAESVYNILVNLVPPEVTEALGKSFTMSAEGRKQAFVKNYAKGMADARTKILAKLAPTIGKRSRSLKKSVTSGEGGGAAWAIVKRRVTFFKNLK
jgi:hypothetical protein